MEKTLYRNEHDKVLAGVASGLGDYLHVDSKIVRVLFVLSIPFLAGAGLLIYPILWIILPVKNDPTAKFKKFNDYFQKQQNASAFHATGPFTSTTNADEPTKWNTPNVGPDFQMNNNFEMPGEPKQNDTSRTIGGLIFLLLGVFLLLRYTFNILPEMFSIWKIWRLWPLAIIAIGISLIFRNQRKSEWERFKKTTADSQQPESAPVTETIVVEENKDSATPNL